MFLLYTHYIICIYRYMYAFVSALMEGETDVRMHNTHACIHTYILENTKCNFSHIYVLIFIIYNT